MTTDRPAECDRHPKGFRCVCLVHTSPLDCDPPLTVTTDPATPSGDLATAHGDWCVQTIRPTQRAMTDSTYMHNGRCRDSRSVSAHSTAGLDVEPWVEVFSVYRYGWRMDQWDAIKAASVRREALAVLGPKWPALSPSTPPEATDDH